MRNIAHKSTVLIACLASLISVCNGAFNLGIGRADCTGPVVEVAFMGYAQLSQRGHGLHLRQFSRAFIIDDNSDRVTYVSVDAAMMSHPVKRNVVRELQRKYGNVYTMDNVIISGTHTHSTPGGFLMYLLYDLPSLGYVPGTFHLLVRGITQSIINAHNNMQEGRLFLAETEIENANINRSPSAYANNPRQEKAQYSSNTDKKLVQLRFMDNKNKNVLGVVNWFAVHPTSMNNTNKLVSSDNMGLASIMLEQEYNPNDLVGKGDFVGAFASTNLGDVSPNLKGPKCQKTGLTCDVLTSSCPDKDICFASGPGRDMFDSTKIIAGRIYKGASKLLKSQSGREITGSIKYAHQFVDMPTAKATYLNSTTNKIENVRGCLPAMGYSFAAGTTDGPGAFDFTQGTTSDNLLWNAVRDFIAEPSEDDKLCQAPKPILLATGRAVFPYLWQPHVVPTQMFLIGDLVLAGINGEFTTMSGRRFRRELQYAAKLLGKKVDVVIAGLSNMYTSYVTTPEEYQIQRYEGASTLYGPHTLTVYIKQYIKLLTAMVNNEQLDAGTQPPNQDDKQISLTTGVIYDGHPINSDYGYVKLQTLNSYNIGDTVHCSFIAGNPRNNPMQDLSYFYVDQKQENGEWKIVATDANWETKFIWERISTIFGLSEIEFYWEIPANTQPGTYRVRHTGYYRYIFGGVYPYEGGSRTFIIQ